MSLRLLIQRDPLGLHPLGDALLVEGRAVVRGLASRDFQVIGEAVPPNIGDKLENLLTFFVYILCVYIYFAYILKQVA